MLLRLEQVTVLLSVTISPIINVPLELQSSGPHIILPLSGDPFNDNIDNSPQASIVESGMSTRILETLDFM